MDRTAILARHEELRALRNPEEAAWRDIAELLSPEDNQFSSQKTRADYNEIYDSTPLYAHDDFVAGMYGQATNPANKWLMLSASSDPELNEFKPVLDWRSTVSNLILHTFQPAVSPFYAEIPASFSNGGAFGNGAMYSEEYGDGRILDRAIPLHELYIERNILGELDTVHREYRMSRRMAAKVFGEGQVPATGGEITVIHAVWPNEAHNPEKLDSKAFNSVYISPDAPALWRKNGYREMPYHVFMWQRGNGSHWGRGPGHRARADMRSLNGMERVHLVAAAFAAEPPTMLHHDSDVTAADIEPNALLFGTISENGKELARVLNRSQNVQLSMQQSQQRRDAIRNAFYFSMMQVVNRPQMTATEVLGYKEESLRMIGPHLARIQTGLLSPLIARRYAILDRMGVLPPPPDELRGRALSVQYTSPLAQAQKASEGRAVMNVIGAVSQIAQFRPDILDNLDADAAFAVLHSAYGADSRTMRDPRQVADDRQARAMQQQRQAQLQDAQAQVDIAATASHAQQALNADNRSRAA